MSIRSLLEAHTKGANLNRLAVAIAAELQDPPELPADALALYDAVEARPPEVEGSWQEVRAARDYGLITPAEYEELAAAVEALTQEDR